MEKEPEERTTALGWHRLEINSDQNGNISIKMVGNLTLAEVVVGLELAKKTLLDKAVGMGIMRAPTRMDVGLNPKRF